MNHDPDALVFDRRHFLGGVSATLAAGALPLTGAAAEDATAEAKAAPPAEMPRRALGKTGLTVSGLCVGSVDPNCVSRAPLGTALKNGVTMIDTAEGYAGGNSEITLGKTLKELNVDRKSLVIVTKTHNRDPQTWKENLRKSLERMQMDYVDLYYMHGLGDRGETDPGMHSTEAVRQAVAELKGAGMCKHFGFSCHTNRPEFMHGLCKNAAEGGHVEVCMLKYNFRDYGNEAFSADIDVLRKADIGVIAMKTQGGASAVPEEAQPFLSDDFNRFQAAIRWALSDKRISAVCSHMANVEQVKQNCEAARNPKMSQGEVRALFMYAMATKSDFCQLCDECTKVCPVDVAIPNLMRYHMYHENYGNPAKAAEGWAKLAASERPDRCETGCDLCEQACPQGIQIRTRMNRVARFFA